MLDGWDGGEVMPVFGWGKREELVEQVEEALPQDETSMEEVWNVDMSQVVVWETVCAWCLAEQGIAFDPADSHGICAYHSAQVLQSYHERKAR